MRGRSVSLLESQMALNGFDGKKLAKMIGMSAVSFYRKKSGQRDWTTREASLVCAALRIQDPILKVDIFLNV